MRLLARILVQQRHKCVLFRRSPPSESVACDAQLSPHGLGDRVHTRGGAVVHGPCKGGRSDRRRARRAGTARSEPQTATRRLHRRIPPPQYEGGTFVGGSLRALFAFDPRRRAIVLVGGDKTNDWKGWYARNIRFADKLYATHLRSLGTETNGRRDTET
jgi:hypothetical protein